MSGNLFIVSGPSGAGKSSLCHALLQRCANLKHLKNLKLSISCTTRNARPGEIDGCEYHFLSSDAFRAQCDAGAFLEWASVHGHLYGTRQRDIEAMMDTGADVLLEIDWQGARQVAEKISSVIRVFILPPSLDELRQRLMARGQDDVEVVDRRVVAARAEIAHADEAQYQIINDNFDDSLNILFGIVTAVEFMNHAG